VRGLPEEFGSYLTYCRGLKFEEKPDYGYCRKLFKDFMHRMNYENDFMYDWVLKKNGKPVDAGINDTKAAALGAARKDSPPEQNRQQIEERKDR